MCFQYIEYRVWYILFVREVATIRSTLTLLRELREDHDLTQREVAEFLGVSQQQYSQYEIGSVELPLRHFFRLAEFFDVSSDYLMGRIDCPKSNSLQNVYVTSNCSSEKLLSDVLSLDMKHRRMLVEYVDLLLLKESVEKKT